MNLVRSHGVWVIAASFLLAFALAVLPMPLWAQPYRPEWCPLVLIYWCMALPQRVGVGVGWCMGLCLDILTGALLGQHALGLGVVAYLALKLHQRVRVTPLWQQALTVAVLLLCYRLLGLWVLGILGLRPNFANYLTPPLISALFWPWVFVVLRGARRHFHIT